MFRVKTLTRTVGLALAMSCSHLAVADNFIPYGTPTVDGTFGRGEWQEMGHIRMARFYGFDQFADFWLQWDNDNLYIAGYLDDYTLFEDGGGSGEPWETWEDDSIEIYLHPGNNPPASLNESSRILAFSMTGKEQRLDRGRWGNEDDINTGLEILGNTNPKIGNAFLNVPIRWVGDCSRELITPARPEVTVRFAQQTKGTINNASDRDQGWQFEVALPWNLVGTSVNKKIVDKNCEIGDAIIPVSPNPQDGMPIRFNFYRINDEDGGKVEPVVGKHTQPNRLGEFVPDGLQSDEWFVYQGDRYHPNEWANFILTHKSDPNDVPKFESTQFGVAPLDGRRVKLTFKAPKRGNGGGAASRYLIRFQEGSINVDEGGWDNMQIFENAYQPAAPGVSQSLEVISLQPGKTYTIAVRAQDEVGRLSREILSRTVTTQGDDHPFVTVSPTGRNLVLTGGSPFVVVGETGLMPWLPLRGLYPGDLCDEHPPKDDSDFMSQKKPCGQGLIDNTGKPINGRIRNYSTEKIFFRCHLQNGTYKDIADITAFGKDTLEGPQDNCDYVAGGLRVTDIEPTEGPNVAERYLRKLKAAGVNTLTVFVESLDLDATPILFEEQTPHVFKFLDKLIELARANEVYLLIRLYDTYYYKDDNYKSNKDKWQRTQWFKKYGKSSPEGFFDEDVYPTHFDRMNQLFTHVNEFTGIAYRDEPHILGWDLLNEIDNKDRFNEASYDKRRKWVEKMLEYARREAPRQLAFFSFLIWDPKDDAKHYRPTLGIDAHLAYQAPGASMAVAHGYYGHVSNPYAEPPSIDYEGPMELVRGTIYGFYQAHDGRPILDGEAAPDPLFIKEGNAYEGRFNEELDMTRFLSGAWLHFAAGGAGANLHWPIDLRPSNGERDRVNQIPPEKREFLSIFKKNVGDIPWRGDQMKIAHRKINDRIVQVTRFDKQNAVAYLYNQDKQSISEVTLADLPVATAQVKVINPRDGNVLYDGSTEVGSGKVVRFSAVNDHVAVIVRNIQQVEAPSDCVAVTDNLGIGATIYPENRGPIKGVWKLGADARTARGDRVIWGYFYADSRDVTWGDENNPEMFVKIWYDVDGRVDVNFFHVSVPNIEVLSCMDGVEKTPLDVASLSKRYVKHTYKGNEVTQKLIETNEVTPAKADGNPKHNEVQMQGIQIGASLQTQEKGAIDGVWRSGGSGTTDRGDQVAWGFFYANPSDVGWGLRENPEVYVKVWYDAVAKRVDVNFFHVSAPPIKVYSTGTVKADYEQGSTVSQEERYTRQEYRR